MVKKPNGNGTHEEKAKCGGHGLGGFWFGCGVVRAVPVSGSDGSSPSLYLYPMEFRRKVRFWFPLKRFPKTVPGENRPDGSGPSGFRFRFSAWAVLNRYSLLVLQGFLVTSCAGVRATRHKLASLIWVAVNKRIPQETIFGAGKRARFICLSLRNS